MRTSPRSSFLGHVLNASGISADPRKTQAIQDMSPPTNVSEVRAYLGMVNHLAKLLPDLSTKTKPQRDLRVDRDWVWDEPQQPSFSQIKLDLTSSEVLILYDPSRPLIVSADASSYGLGAVLLQEEQPGSTRRPVAYASRSLTDTEQRYAQVEKEALASTWACNRFRTYIGLEFTIESDYKPLVANLSTKRLDELTPRLQRFRLKLMEYTYTVTYVPGKEMFTADVLSRSPVDAASSLDEELQGEVMEYEILSMEQLPCTYDRLSEIRSAQKKDVIISRVREHCVTQWPAISTLPRELKVYAEVASDLAVTHDVLLRAQDW